MQISPNNIYFSDRLLEVYDYVSEFSAVLTDYSMKTADTFTFFNEADRLKARAERIRYGEKKVVVDTIAEGYRVFREWFPEDACMMIWKR